MLDGVETHVVPMKKRLSLILDHLEPKIHLSSLQGVDLGEHTDGSFVSRIGFIGKQDRLLVLDII